MGLTVHYSLTTPIKEVSDVRTLLGSLREAALRLAFEEVSPIMEFVGREADFQQDKNSDADRWLKIQAARYLRAGDYEVSVPPRHIIAFRVIPGRGSEPANIGLCSFPAHHTCSVNGRTKRLATGLAGWSWTSFCKTQYASDPRCGGVENFLRCHVGLCRLLDVAKVTDLLAVHVNDESDFWEKRDPRALVATVGEWNQFIAAFAGIFKDQAEKAGVTIEAAITGFPNFEHLEAKGLDDLRRRFRLH